MIMFAVIPCVNAFDVRSGDIVVIAADEVIEDDLYVTAGNFTLDGRVNGDLIVLGGIIEINGVVEGDLMAAGQNVAVEGKVIDDARIAGQVLTLGSGSQVGDDLISAGFSLETKPGSSVGGGLIWGGYQVLLAGDITENADVSAGGLKLQGIVGGDVNADLGEPEDQPSFSPIMFMPDAPAVPLVPWGLTIGDEAKIGGNLDYVSSNDADIPEGSVTKKVTRHEPEVEPKDQEESVSPSEQAANWFFNQFRRLISLLLVGLLMVWFVPEQTKKAADILHDKPLHSLGLGFVAIAGMLLSFLIIILVIILLAIILGMITLGNLMGLVIVLGLLVLFALAVIFWIEVAYIANILVSFLMGQMILVRLKPDASEGRILPLVVGIVIFVILTAIPLLGILISLIVLLMGLGAILMWGWKALKRVHHTPDEPGA